MHATALFYPGVLVHLDPGGIGGAVQDAQHRQGGREVHLVGRPDPPHRAPQLPPAEVPPRQRRDGSAVTASAWTRMRTVHYGRYFQTFPGGMSPGRMRTTTDAARSRYSGRIGRWSPFVSISRAETRTGPNSEGRPAGTRHVSLDEYELPPRPLLCPGSFVRSPRGVAGYLTSSQRPSRRRSSAPPLPGRLWC